jgi:hypothetical protein
LPLASTIFMPQSGQESWVPSRPVTVSGLGRRFFAVIPVVVFR